MSGKRAQEKKRAYLKRRDESLAKQARAVEAELRGEADPVVRMLIRGKAGFLDPAEAARLFLGAVGRDLRYDLEADGFVVRGGYRDAYWHELKSFGALFEGWLRGAARSRAVAPKHIGALLGGSFLAKVEARVRDRLVSEAFVDGLVVPEAVPEAVPALWH